MMKKVSLCLVKMGIDARKMLKIKNSEQGSTAVEYAVIVMVIFSIVLAAMRALGMSVADVFEKAASALGG